MIKSRHAWALLLGASLAACQPFAPKAPRPFEQPQTTAQISAQGTVLSVERPRPEDTQSFVHLMVVPGDKKPIRLVLAPGWYLEREGIAFEPQASVRFEGRSITHDGEESVEVQRIELGERKYILRDEQNRPAWPTKP